MSMVKTSVLVVFVALLTLSSIPAFAQSGSGTALVSDDKGSSDAITVTMTGVTAPTSGKQFVGWLASEYRKVSIGVISVDSNGAVSHTHNSTSSLYSGLNLIRNYNALIITEENEGDIPSSPSSNVIYSAVIPTTSTTVFSMVISLVPTYFPTYFGCPAILDAINFGIPKGSDFMIVVETREDVPPPTPRTP